MKSVLMAHGPLGLCVALCLLVCAPVATAQQADVVAPTVAPAALTSGGQQAADQETTDEELEADRTVDETDPSALTEFRPALDPYGVWVQHPTWGLVWIPNASVVGPQFAPYVTSGHWALSENGEWIWVSDFPFGWAVFHYGRWVSISGVGWAWIPGRRYAPAWVEWRVADAQYAYVGWGPLPPSWIWVGGVAVVVWHPPPIAFVFCPSHYVFHHHPYVHFVRDPVLVRHLGHHTNRYTPRYSRHGYRHSGPSMAEARIPAHALPRHRVASSARLDRPGARRRVAEPDVRRSRAAADPTPHASTSGRSDQARNSVGSRRSHATSDPRGTREPSRGRAAPDLSRSNRAGPRIHSDRTPGRTMRSIGPGRGVVPRRLPSTGARRRR